MKASGKVLQFLQAGKDWEPVLRAITTQPDSRRTLARRMRYFPAKKENVMYYGYGLGGVILLVLLLLLLTGRL